MNTNEALPAPFLFNGLKHHRQIIVAFIDDSIKDKCSIAELNNRMKKIGNSMIDLYYGTLKPEEITYEIERKLKMKGCFDRINYHRYILGTPKKFRSLTLSDGSAWTLLIGREVGSYIHFHPSRGSKFTTRVKALSIRTAIMLKVFFSHELITEDRIALVNRVRVDYLNESPVKNQLDTIRLNRVLNVL